MRNSIYCCVQIALRVGRKNIGKNKKMTNSQKVNPQNTRSLLIRKTSSTVNANNFETGINCIKKVSSLQQKLLSFHLKFKSHIWNIFKKASQKSNALSRISFCMDHKKRKVIIKTYIKLFFGWTITEQWIKKINKINERALAVYQNDTSSLRITLTRIILLKIHGWNLQVLTE